MRHKQSIIFLPGWGFHASIWKMLASKLPGMHFTFCELPTTPTAHHDKLESVTHLLNKQIQHRAILVGWSLGGLIAMNLSQQFPEKYSHLITISSTPRLLETPQWAGVPIDTAHQFLQLAKTNLPQLLLRFRKLVGHPHCHRVNCLLDSHIWRSTEKIKLLYYLEMLMEADIRSQHPSLSIPALYFFGDHDAITPAVCAQQIMLSCKKAQTQLLNDAGHAALLTHTDKIAEQILIFLKATS